MKSLEYWQQKLVQLLHDPPGKPFFLRPGAGGHKAVSAELFEATAGVPLRYVRPAPDRASAGADRPISSPPARTKNVHTIQVDWVNRPILTHPLASGKSGSTAIDFDAVGRPAGQKQTGALAEAVARTLREIVQPHATTEEDIEALPDEERARREEEESAGLAALPLWKDTGRLQEVCMRLWRRLPESTPPGAAEVLWQQQPADSRAPDHSLWDHLRVASSLAFLASLKERKREREQEGAAMPWLLAFSIGPVQRFIAQSRTSSDLWTTSMLLSDLIWHAMVPFVERYGPESIVYPDLRRNPRADQWLWEQQERGRWRGVLPLVRGREPLNPCSYAGIFPNTFVALVPRGGDGSLDPLQDVAGAAREEVKARWKELAALTKGYFLEQARKRRQEMTDAEKKVFEAIWERQHREVLFTAWSAAAWPNMERVEHVEALAIRQALPAQGPAAALSAEDQQALNDWHARHTPWVPTATFARYAEARYVYAGTNRQIHQCQRGFDYPLIHHALHTRHALRKAEAQGAPIEEEAGEKCTLCGVRQALGAARSDGTIDAQREALRSFWSRLDRHSEGGAERLCAVCTMKRLLIRAGLRGEKGSRRMAGLTAAWAGPATPMDEVLDDDDELRVPFPSTATMAAQAYLCAVVRRPALRAAMVEVVRCCEAAQLPRTSFVRSLRSLAEAAQAADETGQRFLEYEAELTAFPEAVAAAEMRAPQPPAQPESEGETYRGALRDRNGEPVPQAKVTALRSAVQRLRKEARDLGILSGSQVAVIAIDGDTIRKVLLGTELGARWCDVIHPAAVALMKENDVTKKAGWTDLLDRTRLMGPSTHAFVNRVLASFAHTIVPWVVEREADGRLIYAGGDDVLALAPARQALDIAARLAQLYSASWVLDTRPDEEPWSWRKRDAAVAPDPNAAQRFVVVAPNSDRAPIPWPIPNAYRLPSVARPGRASGASETERLLPMMGAGQTLSAGIAIGHYKTPLGVLVEAAWQERDRAKGKAEDEQGGNAVTKRNAFSIRRHTRAGDKARLRLAWGKRDAGPEEAFTGYERATNVIEAFQSGTLAGRLPYKLREVEDAVVAVWWHGMKALREGQRHEDEQARRELLSRVRPLAKGLFLTQAEGGTQADSGAEDAFEIWWQGLCGGFQEQEQRWGEVSPRGIGSEQGLAVCRFLGALGRGKEES